MRLIFSILFLMFFFACSSPDLEQQFYDDKQASFCMVERDNTYDLMESYFSKDDVLTHKVVVHYFHNEKEDRFSEGYIKDRHKVMDEYFAGTNRKFRVDSFVHYEGAPMLEPDVFKKIELIEQIGGKGERPDLRNQFHIVHYDFWASLLNVDGALNLYIYDNINDGYAGVAGGIGSTFLAMRWDYMDVRLATLEHEYGHCLGLYHTHQHGTTNGLNNFDGDKVCDTAMSEDDLFHYMDNNCQYTGNKFEGIPLKCQELVLRNFMSYGLDKCRSIFTIGQNRRMQKTLETSSDLRKTVKELNFDTPSVIIPKSVQIEKR